MTFAFLMLASTSFAQTSRYVVHFNDKSGTSYSIDAPEQFLSARAIQRRIDEGVTVTSDDFPVNASYVQQVSATGAKVFFTSRWLNCALIEADASLESAINNLSFVSSVEYVAPGPHASGGRIRAFKNRKGSGVAAPTMTQLSMVGIDTMHMDDVRGLGILIAVLDAGYQGVDTAEPFQHLFTNNSIAYTYDFVGASSAVYRYDEHGTEVFSVLAAHSDGYTGGAYDATFQLYITEDEGDEYRVEEYNWLFAAERADSSGVDIIHSSLGYNTFDDATMDYAKSELNGVTAVVSRAALAALNRGIVVVCSAGNEGTNSWGLVTPPADVDGVLAVGSVTQAKTKSSFSSIGPTADNRLKPDIMAMGSGTSVVRPTGAVGAVNGTSVAAPIITSLAAGIMQRFPELSAREVYDTIISSGSKALNPDNLMGYGIPSYSKIVKGLTPFHPDEPITIFPNPAGNGKYNVLLDEINQDVEIQIFDLRGTALGNHRVSVTWQNNPFELDLSSLAPGSYLVKVKTKDNFKTTTLVRL